jgi:hypothetical protein
VAGVDSNQGVKRPWFESIRERQRAGGRFEPRGRKSSWFESIRERQRAGGRFEPRGPKSSWFETIRERKRCRPPGTLAPETPVSGEGNPVGDPGTRWLRGDSGRRACGRSPTAREGSNERSVVGVRRYRVRSAGVWVGRRTGGPGRDLPEPTVPDKSHIAIRNRSGAATAGTDRPSRRRGRRR